MIKQSGQLDRRVIFQSQASSTDAFGQNVGSWSDTLTLWAKVVERSGSESEQSNQIVAVRKVDFIIRYNSQINELFRVSYRSKIYEIEAIIQDEARDSFMRIETRLAD